MKTLNFKINYNKITKEFEDEVLKGGEIMNELHQVYELTYELSNLTTGCVRFLTLEQAEAEAEELRKQDKQANICIEQITVSDLSDVWEG